MEDKKAKFIVYIVICLIAFMCSSTVYSMTGGLSDWLVSSVNSNEDANNNGYLDSSEGQYYSSSDDSYDSGDNSGIFDGIFSSSDSDSDSYSSSEEEPDLLARIIRGIIGGISTPEHSYDSNYESNYYYEDTSNGDGGSSLSELFEKANNKLDQMFNNY